jgi:hypothetical protein
MLYALFTGERGLFIRDRYGNAISQLAFEAPVELGESTETVRAIHLYLFFSSFLGILLRLFIFHQFSHFNITLFSVHPSRFLTNMTN